MFNEAFDSLDQTTQLFLKTTIDKIRELVRKYGETCFEKTCNELLKKPEAITRWLNDNENTLRPTDKECLARQYLILTVLHDDYIDRTAISPIYFTDKIKQNEETAQVYQAIGFKYYAAFRASEQIPAERLKIKAYIIDVLKAVEANLSKQASGKTDLAKGLWYKRIIGWIFKKTSHIVYTIVAFVFTTIAAVILVDIFADFGWLEPIKAFIYKILLHK